MENLPVNPECILSGTRYCRLLNMGSCEKCTIRTAEDKEGIAKDLDVYDALLPEGGIARLFTSRTCMLCRHEPKGERSGYAILDMAHPEPKRTQRWLLGKRTLKVGTMIPVQLSTCKKCRTTLLLTDYLPVIGAVLFGFASLLLLTKGQLADTLKNASSAAPFYLWALITVLGLVTGKLVGKLILKKANARMYVDALEQPAVAEMVRLGWMPINGTGKRTRVLFSKSRVARGLGTAAEYFPPEPKQDPANSAQTPKNG